MLFMKNLFKLNSLFKTSSPHLSYPLFCLGSFFLILVSVQRVNCQSFTCGCTGSGVLNIDASPASPHFNPALGGALYSVLEAAFNYDQDNDGDIDILEHNGCIAIAGRLIIDQNLAINNCSNIKMQPCAEVFINAHKSLTLTQNTIYGCEQMWRGINVQPFGKLSFQLNEIRDAQYAIFANASGVIWPPPEATLQPPSKSSETTFFKTILEFMPSVLDRLFLIWLICPLHEIPLLEMEQTFFCRLVIKIYPTGMQTTDMQA